MNSVIKLKDISSTIEVLNIEKIICTSDHQSETVKNFEEFHFFSSYYYVFVGENILHVRGNNIEYVIFKKN